MGVHLGGNGMQALADRERYGFAGPLVECFFRRHGAILPGRPQSVQSKHMWQCFGRTVAGMNTVKAIRERIGFSQSQLARALEVQPTTISTYENGRAEISRSRAQTLIDLAKVHGLLIDFNHIYAGVDLPPDRSAKRAGGVE